MVSRQISEASRLQGTRNAFTALLRVATVISGGLAWLCSYILQPNVSASSSSGVAGEAAGGRNLPEPAGTTRTVGTRTRTSSTVLEA